MVEIHHVVGERPSTIGARPLLELSEHLPIACCQPASTLCHLGQVSLSVRLPVVPLSPDDADTRATVSLQGSFSPVSRTKGRRWLRQTTTRAALLCGHEWILASTTDIEAAGRPSGRWRSRVRIPAPRLLLSVQLLLDPPERVLDAVVGVLGLGAPVVDEQRRQHDEGEELEELRLPVLQGRL